MSPYTLEAVKGLALIGDEDPEDDGKLSGAAICDMARAAVALVIDSWRWESEQRSGV